MVPMAKAPCCGSFAARAPMNGMAKVGPKAMMAPRMCRNRMGLYRSVTSSSRMVRRRLLGQGFRTRRERPERECRQVHVRIAGPVHGADLIGRASSGQGPHDLEAFRLPGGCGLAGAENGLTVVGHDAKGGQTAGLDLLAQALEHERGPTTDDLAVASAGIAGRSPDVLLVAGQVHQHLPRRLLWEGGHDGLHLRSLRPPLLDDLSDRAVAPGLDLPGR